MNVHGHEIRTRDLPAKELKISLETKLKTFKFCFFFPCWHLARAAGGIISRARYCWDPSSYSSQLEYAAAAQDAEKKLKRGKYFSPSSFLSRRQRLHSKQEKNSLRLFCRYCLPSSLTFDLHREPPLPKKTKIRRA